MPVMNLVNSEVRDGAKVLVLHTIILNNSKEEQGPIWSSMQNKKQIHLM